MQVAPGQCFRRIERPESVRWLGRLRGSAWYELWRGEGPPAVLTRSQLDRSLDGRRYPADYWVAVDAADAAFAEGDRTSWIEFGTGLRLPVPPNSDR